MNHFHNILGISPKKAIAVSQQDVCLYWVKRVLLLTVSNLGRFGVIWRVTEGLSDREKKEEDISLLSFCLS